ncbi:MAG: Ig-like domain-containing protein, partial [Gemmatimonadetes bacterium]|nr:Ig-like domain-containing protein [Gemmatimonadota bacterium]
VDAIQESEGVYFLPPLAPSNPSPVGDFNPDLSPGAFVCELDQLGLSGQCVSGDPIADFAPGSFSVGNGQYQLSWDTDGPETGRFNTNRFYRLNVTVGDQVVGSIDLDPQNPNGPGQSNADAYAFRVGETIPIKVWLGLEVLCTGQGFVTECITGAIIDQTGASLALTSNGPQLGLDVSPNSLPGSTPVVTAVLERIDPALYLQLTGEECIPLFDAPQFGACFRITTYPDVPDGSLVNPALVSICETTSSFGLTPAQQSTLNMIRYEAGTYEALVDAVGNCPVQTAGMLPVPEGGIARFAAQGLNQIAAWLMPQQAHAQVQRPIRLGAFTSSFSNFRFALPGVMIPTDGVGAVIQDGAPNVIDASVTVRDYLGNPVPGAMVDFSTADGTPSPTTATTGSDGVARTQWTVDVSSPGTKTLTASALGLVSVSPPDEQSNAGFLATESVTIDVTVVGPPAALTQNPTGTLSGTAGTPVGDLSVTVFDDAGNPISGAGVTWTGDGTVVGGTTTGSDGSATGTWTLGQTSGPNTVTANVGSLSVDFTANGAAGPAVTPTYSTVPPSGTAGLGLPPITVTVVDQFGNPREGDAVTWTVTSGGGSISASSTATGADGTSAVTWTLGQAVGSNALRVEVAGPTQPFTQDFTVQGLVGAAVQPVTTTGDGQTGTVGQPLASPLTILVTDQFGNPRAGEDVSWSDGASTTTVPTDASGLSSYSWTLGTVAGSQSASASVGSFSPVSFTATANPGAAANLASSGAGGTYPIGSTVSDLQITVTDAFGNPVPGDAVSWVVTGGGGSIVGDATADAAGVATAAWTLGSIPGLNTATASVGALTADFTATGECFPGYGVAQVDGTFNPTEWACASSFDFEANISGGSTPATVFWQNDGTNLYMAVRILQNSLDKVNTLRIDIDSDGDGVAERNDDVIGVDDETGFFDRHLTQRCVNSGQASCGNDDTSADGAGAVDNDGTFTVFELVHPLNSGESTDLAVGTGDTFGFFLSLQSGNGAQGNTQVPAFRVYQDFTVVGF